MGTSCKSPLPDGSNPQVIGQGKSILIVDDSDAVRDVIRTFLERTGYQVCGEAADGFESIELAKQLKPDLIVMDLSMPRMNGVEAASVIRPLMPDVPIVVLTMYGDALGKSLSAAIGAKAVVPKAEGMTNLVECIKNLLGPIQPSLAP